MQINILHAVRKLLHLFPFISSTTRTYGFVRSFFLSVFICYFCSLTTDSLPMLAGSGCEKHHHAQIMIFIICFYVLCCVFFSFHTNLAYRLVLVELKSARCKKCVNKILCFFLQSVIIRVLWESFKTRAYFSFFQIV